LQRAATICVTTTTTVARIVRIGNVTVWVVWVNAGVIGMDRRRSVEVWVVVIVNVIVVIVVGLGLLGLQLMQRLHVLQVWLVVVIVIHSGSSSAVMQKVTLSFRFKLRNEAGAEASGTVPVKHRVRVERACIHSKEDDGWSG